MLGTEAKFYKSGPQFALTQRIVFFGVTLLYGPLGLSLRIVVLSRIVDLEPQLRSSIASGGQVDCRHAMSLSSLLALTTKPPSQHSLTFAERLRTLIDRLLSLSTHLSVPTATPKTSCLPSLSKNFLHGSFRAASPLVPISTHLRPTTCLSPQWSYGVCGAKKS